MKIHDAIVGALLAALGIAILVHIQGYPTIPGQRYGPALFPGLIASGFVVCGALLLRRGIRRGGPALVAGAWTRSFHHASNFALVIGALVFYLIASEPLGFPVAGSLILLALFWKLGVRLAIAVPAAPAATLVVHTLFYKLMRVPLPWGVLEPLAW